MRCVAALPLCAAGAADIWCHGVVPPSLDASAGNIDVIFAQAALFSTNPKFGDSLAKYNLFHTAVVFQQGNESWTLEFDLTAQNKAGATAGAGFVPTIDGSVLTWDNAARWCLTEGILHNRSHWTQAWDIMAQITPAQFDGIFTDLVLPKNKSIGQAPFYNGFRVVHNNTPPEARTELVDDVTCANGVIWLRDYLREQQVETAELDYKVTRFNINAGEVREADITDTAVWADIVSFYEHLSGVLTQPPSGPQSFVAWLQHLFGVLPMRYIYDASNDKYMEVIGNEAPYLQIAYEPAPSPWVPSPPAPPAPSTAGIREICVQNSGGYALEWQLSFGDATSSMVDAYPLGQVRCITGAQAGAVDGQAIGCIAHAVAGNTVTCNEGPDKQPSAHIFGSASDKRANYKCDGTTLSINCYLTGFEHIDVPPAPAPAPTSGVREICIENRGGYALEWQLTYGDEVSEKTSRYPNPQTRCLSGSDVGADEGVELGCRAHAVAGHTVDCVGKRNYSSSSSMRANYKCDGATLSISCRFTGLSVVESQQDLVVV